MNHRKISKLGRSMVASFLLFSSLSGVVNVTNVSAVTQSDPAPTIAASTNPAAAPNGTTAPSGETILFDNTHGETAGQADWVIDGAFSDFANAVAAEGYNVKELRSTNAYTANPTITPEALQGVSVLVLAESQIPFKQSEQQAIADFVSNGGSVLYIADHYNSDRNKNTIDSNEAFNGYRRGAFTQAAAQATAAAEGNPNNYYPNLDPMTAGMSSAAANSGPMQGVVTSDWLSDTFGVRFRYNAVDNLANDGQVPVNQANDAFGITKDVNDVALHAGGTIEITNPNTAYGLVYLPALTNTNKSTYAVDDGVYGDAASGNPDGGGGGTNEGAFVAIAKHGKGKAAFIGDTSMVEDATPKYTDEDGGGLKSTFAGFEEQNDSVLLENLMNWLGTEQSDYSQFDQAGVADSDLPNDTLAPATPIITKTDIANLQTAGDTSKYLQYMDETPAESTEVPGTEPWAAPSTGYLWYDSTTFANGSFGSTVDPVVQPTYQVTYPTTNSADNGKAAIVAGQSNNITIHFTGLTPNTMTTAQYSVGIYGLNGNASQIGTFSVPGQTTTQTAAGYSTKFAVTADANGNGTATIQANVPASDTGSASFRIKMGSNNAETDSIDIIASSSTPTATPTVTTKNTTLNVGDTWNSSDNFTSATDSEGNTITDVSKVTVSGTVDTTKAGSYPVTYSYTDPTTNLTGIATATVTVVDPNVPVFNAVPATSASFDLPDTITAGQITKATIKFTGLTPNTTYTGLNFGLYTSADFGSFTSGNQIATTQIGDDGMMSTTPAYSGQFSITADANGNASQLVYFTADATTPAGTYNLRLRQTPPTGASSNLVTVKPTISSAPAAPVTAPVIKVKDSTINQGDSWTARDNFVSAMDSAGNSLDISKLTVTGSVDTAKAGEYTVIYSYVDSQTNLSDSERATVTVTAKNPEPEKTVFIYRLYNKNTGEHFYTASAAEKNALVKAGWSYEGIGWTAPVTGTAVYRVYNPNAKGGDHYYTKSKAEATSLVKLGWKWDNNSKPVFYSGGNAKVYVAYNPNAQSGAHNYTKTLFEQNSLLKAGWKFGAVAWNAE